MWLISTSGHHAVLCGQWAAFSVELDPTLNRETMSVWWPAAVKTPSTFNVVLAQRSIQLCHIVQLCLSLFALPRLCVFLFLALVQPRPPDRYLIRGSEHRRASFDTPGAAISQQLLYATTRIFPMCAYTHVRTPSRRAQRHGQDRNWHHILRNDVCWGRTC